MTITVTILDIIHRTFFYLKHDVSETSILYPYSGVTYSFGPNRVNLSLRGLDPLSESSCLNTIQNNGYIPQL
jgi:hypothetical protein